MATTQQRLTARTLDLLDHQDNEGFKTAHLEYLDTGAVEEARYEEVLPALDARISKERYSLISMLLAGIYFGLLVGGYLYTLAWPDALQWAVPVGLVCLYALVTGNNILTRLIRLTKARALVEALAEENIEALGD